MRKSALILALALGVSAWPLIAQDQGGGTPNGDPPPPAGPPGAPGGPGPRPGFHLLPPRAVEILNLSDDQKKQLADLEAEVKTKIENILTPDQLEKLKQLPPPPRGPGMGGPGRRGPRPPGPDGQGGPGGPRGPGNDAPPQPPGGQQ